MSYLVNWSPYSIKCVERIYIFLAAKDIELAKNLIKKLYDSTFILETFPFTGRASHDLQLEQRELLIPFGSSGYVLLYHVSTDNKVIVLAIRHQKEVAY